MSNKLIDKERLKQMWEDIKMLDIIEIARAKGMREGKLLGTLETTKEILLDVLIEKFNNIPKGLAEQIRSIRKPWILRILVRQVVKCSKIQEFENTVAQLSNF